MQAMALMLSTLFLIFAATGPTASGAADTHPHIEADVCIYGGAAAGVIAAVQAQRMGKRAVIIECGRHLGGLTSGGLGATDSGNRAAIGGMARDFYAGLRDYYLNTYGPDSQQLRDCHDGYRFEPHVAENAFKTLVQNAGIPVYFAQRLARVEKRGNRIRRIVMESGAVFTAKMFIDATYEGDLMAKAGVSYTVGREGNAQYGETLNGVQLGRPYQNFSAPVDPYVITGAAWSHLLLGISADPPGKQGEGDRRVQAYNFRMCLTKNPENRIPFPKPAGYDPARYTLLARYINAGVWDALNLSTPMPNGKTDTNNHGGFSTDDIGMNYDYPDGDYATRERIFEEHKTYQQGLMWFLCHDERVPAKIRDAVSQWGLAKDEFQDTGGWPFQLYVREARRMVSDYVMTEHNCRGTVKAPDSVGLASYGMDSHHVQRIVVNGRVMNEGDVQVGGFSPYPISYRAIIPRASQCANLLVPVCLSASHIAYGSIRMEPVFMILGQSAATAACQAIDQRVPVQRVSLKALQERLRADGQILEWKGGVNAVAMLAPKSFPGIALDDKDGVKTGEWIPSSIPGGRLIGDGYLHDGNANKGKLSIAYTPNLPFDGEYQIILFASPNPNRATNAPVTIAIAGGGAYRLRVNQRDPAAEGALNLGRFHLPAGSKTTVTLSNADTDGHVIADGIQFLPIKP